MSHELFIFFSMIPDEALMEKVMIRSFFIGEIPEKTDFTHKVQTKRLLNRQFHFPGKSRNILRRTVLAPHDDIGVFLINAGTPDAQVSNSGLLKKPASGLPMACCTGRFNIPKETANARIQR
jgi:hypothetical protein